MANIFWRKKFNFQIIVFIIFVLAVVFLRKSEFFINSTLVILKNLSFQSIKEIGYFLNDFFSFSSIRNQYYNLKEENLRLKNLEGQYYQLKEENENLKVALSLKKTNFEVTPSKIILIDPSPLPFYFWLDKGLDDGIKPEMNVITQDKILIGKITNCYKNFCQGEFIFAPEKKIGVEILNKNTKGLAFRDKNGAYLLTYVLEGANIEKGDLVVTAGGSKFLKNFLIAKVKEQKESSLKNQGYSEFYLDPLIDYSMLDNVLIIKNLFN